MKNKSAKKQSERKHNKSYGSPRSHGDQSNRSNCVKRSSTQLADKKRTARYNRNGGNKRNNGNKRDKLSVHFLLHYFSSFIVLYIKYILLLFVYTRWYYWLSLLYSIFIINISISPVNNISAVNYNVDGERKFKTNASSTFLQGGIADDSSELPQFLWAGVGGKSTSAGVFYRKKNALPTLWVSRQGENFKVRAGHLESSVDSGFILSGGGYFPYAPALPYKRPAGIQLQVKRGAFSYGYRHFIHASSLHGYDFIARSETNSESYKFQPVMQMLMHSLWIKPKNIPISLGVKAASTFDGPPNDVYYPIYNVKSLGKVNTTWIKADVTMSEYFGFAASISAEGGTFKTGYSYHKANVENVFSAQIYTLESTHRLYFVEDNIYWNTVFEEDIVYTRFRVNFNGPGFYAQHRSGFENFIGVFYYSSQEQPMPSASFYYSPETGDSMYSFGASLKDRFRASVVIMEADYDVSYPLDPVFYPAAMYRWNLRDDSSAYFSGKWRGLEFIVNQENIQWIGYALQAPVPAGETKIRYLLRFRYAKEF